MAILGRNGQESDARGETSLGEVILDGGIRLASRRTALRRPSTHCAEDKRIFGSLDLKENLAGLTGCNQWPLDRVYGMFPRLKARRASRDTQLSGGEQQMLAIARTGTDPKIVLLKSR